MKYPALLIVPGKASETQNESVLVTECQRLTKKKCFPFNDSIRTKNAMNKKKKDSET